MVFLRNPKGKYWTWQSIVNSASPPSAWVVNFETGVLAGGQKSSSSEFAIRLVVGPESSAATTNAQRYRTEPHLRQSYSVWSCPGPSSAERIAPDSRYELSEPDPIDHPGQWVVTDTETGLTWQQCPFGLEGDGCNFGDSKVLSWEEAIRKAHQSDWGGYKNWRLPNVMELNSLLETGCWQPAINETVFPATFGSVTELSTFWSGTTALHGSLSMAGAWVVSFQWGYTHMRDKMLKSRIRLVRGDVYPSILIDDFEP